jgi:two-component system response regulator EvgA
MPLTVLIVDAHAPFRRLARELIEADGFAVVGEAADGARALERVEALQPDVVLLDLQLPDFSGLEVARRIARTNGEPPAIVLTSTRDGADFNSLINESGARGFIGKSDFSVAELHRLVG